MRIVYHLGAHCTDEERLLRCLLKNRGTLADQGIAVPGPARYRMLVRDTAVSLNGRPASRDTQALVLDQIMEEATADRLVLSWENFLAFPQWVLRGALYPSAGDRMRAITRIFPEIGAEFHLAVRNPATFIPALMARQRGRSYAEVMKGLHPQDLLWSDLVRDIREANPEVPLTIWCDEDTPLIWPEVLRAVSGHAPRTVLEGTDDLLAGLMSPEGLARLTAALSAHPPRTVKARRRITAEHLERHGRPEQLEQEIDLPGWTPALAEALTAQYDDDIARIAALPGVRLIAA